MKYEKDRRWPKLTSAKFPPDRKGRVAALFLIRHSLQTECSHETRTAAWAILQELGSHYILGSVEIDEVLYLALNCALSDADARHINDYIGKKIPLLLRADKCFEISVPEGQNLVYSYYYGASEISETTKSIVFCMERPSYLFPANEFILRATVPQDDEKELRRIVSFRRTTDRMLKARLKVTDERWYMPCPKRNAADLAFSTIDESK